MHIDSYKFGQIVVDGVSYSSDIIILGGSVQPNWWRREGHLLSVEDLESVIKERPSVLVIGCGASGLMKVPAQTRQVLQEQNIDVKALNTGEAVGVFNELAENDIDVAAALHLTC